MILLPFAMLLMASEELAQDGTGVAVGDPTCRFLCTSEWESLFDGKAFDSKATAGWRTQTKSEFPGHAWKVEDGCLRSVAAAPRVDLSTSRSFRNFELEFEWKLEEGTNSGVKYLVFGIRPNSETGKLDPDVPKALGFELQLADDNKVPDAKSKPSYSTGALYGYVAPHDVPALKVGQWHKARIVVVVRVWNTGWTGFA